MAIEIWHWGLRTRIRDWVWCLRLEILITVFEFGDRGWGLGIEDGDWALGFGLGSGIRIGIRELDRGLRLVIGWCFGLRFGELGLRI